MLKSFSAAESQLASKYLRTNKAKSQSAMFYLFVILRYSGNQVDMIWNSMEAYQWEELAMLGFQHRTENRALWREMMKLKK